MFTKTTDPHNVWLPMSTMWVHAQSITGPANLRLSDLNIQRRASPISHRAGPDNKSQRLEQHANQTTSTTIEPTRVTFLDTDDDPGEERDWTAQSPKRGVQVIVDPIAIAQEDGLAGEGLLPNTDTLQNRHATDRVWPPPRKESLTNRSQTPWATKKPTENMDTINIAVIGALGCGKSTFIQRALRLSRLPTSNTATVRQDVEGIPHVVTLVEFDLDYFDLEDVAVAQGQQIQWPKQINGQFVPRLEGAFVLYDVMNRDSVADFPVTLSILSTNNLLSMTVATKCDVPEDQRYLDPARVARMASSSPLCFGDYQTSLNSPGSPRDCLQTMLKTILSHRRGTWAKTEPSNRRRAASTANTLDAPSDPLSGRPLSQGNNNNNNRHSRASSDLSLLRGFPAVATDGFYRPSSRSPNRPADHNRDHLINVPATASLDASGEFPLPARHGMLRTPGIRLDGAKLEQHGGDTFLEMEESDTDLHRDSDDIPVLQRNDESYADRSAKVMGVSFDELVDRLVAMKMSRADANFADIFLCLYRKFAPPGKLFSALRARLEGARDDKGTHYLLKTEFQLRIVDVIAKWVSLYPGDFARPTTRRGLDELIRHLSTEPIFAAAANQMRLYADQKVMEDDDTGWALSDDVEDGADDGSASQSQRGSQISERLGLLQLDDISSAESRRPSQGSDRLGSEHSGRPPATFQFYSYEDYEREAATMVPISNLPLDKVLYRAFMNIDADDLADEITRIDWVMFSSIRVRDLVRHVSLSKEQKDRCRSLKNVNRMISHFNHVAKWVANMILIRDKVKHRAPALEKFMNIATKLRQLNNYNGLAAVLAGISDTAIHRLGQTRALVDQSVQKRFARLQLLMGTQKSHFAYRLAWENSPLPRIPFIPLHRRDLVSAEEGSKTFVGPDGDRINWKKFEVLGEVILPLMKSQGQPYPNLGRHEHARQLILDCNIMTDDEDIYQRSQQLESGMGESSRKKFPWLPN